METQKNQPIEEYLDLLNGWWLPEKKKLISDLIKDAETRNLVIKRDLTETERLAALKEACKKDDVEALLSYIASGGDPDSMIHGQHPLEMAVKARCLNVAKMLAQICNPTATTSELIPLKVIVASETPDEDPCYDIIDLRGRKFTDFYKTWRESKQGTNSQSKTVKPNNK